MPPYTYDADEQGRLKQNSERLNKERRINRIIFALFAICFIIGVVWCIASNLHLIP